MTWLEQENRPALTLTPARKGQNHNGQNHHDLAPMILPGPAYVARRILMRLHHVAWLILNRKNVNRRTIAEKLGVKRKTIERDIILLRALGHDIQWSIGAQCYFYATKPLSLADPNRRLLI